MERKKRKKVSGFYITVCSCLVVAAIIGYANRKTDKNVTEEESQIPIAEAQFPQITAPPAVSEVSGTADVVESVPVGKTVQAEEEIEFNPPVAGKVIEEFSGDDLIYNEALQDWRAHSGVDFAAELGEQVLASAAGTVEQVYDSNMGRCVVVGHQDGFKTVYANLDENTPVQEGTQVAQGDVIGVIGNTALGDSTDLPHLHFEIISDSKNVNPVDYLE